MLLKTFQFIRTTGPNIRAPQRITQCIFTANHTSKRNAGHSEWANRRSAREASALRKSTTISRLSSEIRKAILSEKNANPALNSKLRAVLSEAQKASIPQSTLDKLIKPLAAILNRENIISFAFSHSVGILSVVNISTIQPGEAKRHLAGTLKKFGFKCDDNVLYKEIGIIIGKPIQNVENIDEKSVEHAIMANCEEVNKKDDGSFEFLCEPTQIDHCAKILEDLGYEINLKESNYEFPSYKQVDAAILERLEKMEERLEAIPGFLKITYNTY